MLNEMMLFKDHSILTILNQLYYNESQLNVYIYKFKKSEVNIQNL